MRQLLRRSQFLCSADNFACTREFDDKLQILDANMLLSLQLIWNCQFRINIQSNFVNAQFCTHCTDMDTFGYNTRDFLLAPIIFNNY